MADVNNKKASRKKILVFSTSVISDLGIDMAGSAHMHYSTSVQVIPLPCSSGIKPAWIVHALEKGYDGVFIAACGGDCAYLSGLYLSNECLARESAGHAQRAKYQPEKNKDGGDLLSVCG